MSRIFVSYRRDETSGHAGRLIDRLNGHFGRERVFFDLQTIRPGMDRVKALESALSECSVLIAVIGKAWAEGLDRKGRRRIDSPEDSLRREVATALQREVLVVPVLVQGATMPDSTDLPDDLAPLTRRQAIELTDVRWDYDVAQLIEALEHTVDPGIDQRAPARDASPPPVTKPETVPEPRLGGIFAEGPLRDALELSQIVTGAWQMQVVNPTVGVATLAMEFQAAGAFRGQIAGPLGFSSVQGQWQTLPGRRLALSGQQTSGFQSIPYAVLIQLFEVGPARLAGISGAGEQVVFQRTG